MPKSSRRLLTLVDVIKPSRQTIICDVGANPLGDPVYKPLLRAGICQVWGFEPQKDAYDKLCETADVNENYVNAAIGSGKDETLRICRSSGFSSLLEPSKATIGLLQRWQKQMTVVDRVTLHTTALDDLDDLPAPDLLKIDIQGAELSVFNSGASKLASTGCIISEVAFIPLYEHQPLIADQISALSELGFHLHRFMHLVAKPIGSKLRQKTNWRKNHNQLIDGDAVFIRRLMNLQTIGDEELKHLAICAEGIFQSRDIVLLCLDILLDRGSVLASSVQTYIDDLE